MNSIHRLNKLNSVKHWEYSLSIYRQACMITQQCIKRLKKWHKNGTNISVQSLPFIFSVQGFAQKFYIISINLRKFKAPRIILPLLCKFIGECTYFHLKWYYIVFKKNWLSSVITNLMRSCVFLGWSMASDYTKGQKEQCQYQKHVVLCNE